MSTLLTQSDVRNTGLSVTIRCSGRESEGPRATVGVEESPRLERFRQRFEMAGPRLGDGRASAARARGRAPCIASRLRSQGQGQEHAL